MALRIPNLDFLDNESSYRRFVGYLHLALVLASLLVLLDTLSSTPVSYERVGLIAAYLAAVLASRWQLRRHGAASAIAMVVVGLWLVTATTVLMLSGIHSPALLIFPFLITLSGWVMSRRQLLAIAAVTVLFVLGLGLAEHFGLLNATPRGTATTATVVTVTILVLFGLLTAVTFESFARSRDTAVALSESMALHNIELAQREREIRLIIDNMGAGMAAFSLDSRLRFANRGYARLFGFLPDELVGRSIRDFAPAEVLPVFEPAWKRCMEDGKFVSYRRSHRHPVSGVESVIDVELTPDVSYGKVEGLFVLVIDVTEKVRAEEQIRELNEKLEQRVKERTAELDDALERLHRSTEELAISEAKSTVAALVASVSHELGTPIGNSVMTASAINKQTKDFLVNIDLGQLKRSDLSTFLDSLNQATELILRNLHRAEGLVSSFKQVSADQASEQRRQFDLANAVQEVLSTLAPTLRRKPHRVKLDIPAGITMDSLPGPLGQIVINLINNAYLHAFEGRNDGVMTITATADERHVKLRFADNGVGIGDENLKKLFQPFFSTKIGQGGTGLGMTIVQNLVNKSLGGSVNVTSTVGVGTTFAINLPRALPAVQLRLPPSGEHTA